MRWEDQLFALFDDLEAQASVLHGLEREAELADRSRAEYSHVTLASRLAASTGREVVLDVTGLGRVAGELRRTGAGWCLLRGHQQDWIVRTALVALVHGASERSVPEVAWSPLQRLGLGSALRGLAEQRLRCVLHLADGTTHEAVVSRVGQDFVEAEAPSGARLLVSYDAIAAVQSRD
ncbi:hypothetical protein DDE18_07230 [Nocardioides gansuensis]|uniref:Uncharacterized protein n=1 Tax=Nocardioides gansuensis TaxID=2138300 RepID=A0A2T8FBM9_9ACTN|nr:hypothetical protein [Nocardioides gansuensis]PVG83112.1 hypothetical protein DDE18_07230 [Nocardioides gansuensis]